MDTNGQVILKIPYAMSEAELRLFMIREKSWVEGSLHKLLEREKARKKEAKKAIDVTRELSMSFKLQQMTSTMISDHKYLNNAVILHGLL